MATNKKLSKFIVLGLLSVVGLTACSSNEVVAKPSDYDNKIITDGIKDSEKIDSNIISTVYDALHEGTLASDVLDEVLYQYAVSVFGRYNKLVGPKSSESELNKGTTLKEAVRSAKSADKAVANKFIQEHKAYWLTDIHGERISGDGSIRTDDGSIASEEELDILVSKWDSIEKRIKKAIYNEIKEGAYTNRYLFSEKSYLRQLKADLEKVADYANSLTDLRIPTTFEAVFDYEDVFTHYLHRENYQQNYGIDEDESANTITYIEDSFIKSIYRDLLTEQYIYDETYNTLGRSFARKVNIIKLATKSDADKAAQYLINYFVNNVVYAKPNAATVAESTNKVTEEEFDLLSNAIVGTDETNKYLIDSGAFENTGTYYLGTDYGDLMEEYSKIKDNPLLTDSTVESTFTNSGAYSKEVGLELKTRELDSNSYVTKGWYIKNGGLTDFSIFRDRLFNPAVANAIDVQLKEGESVDKYDRFQMVDGAWTIDTSKDYNNYVARINGKYYLKNTTSEGTSDANNDIIFYDSSSKTYYVVQIEEAVSSSKFNKSGSWNYEKIKGDRKIMSDYINEVAEILVKDDSYQTLSKKHWLSEMKLEYHDTVVYEYFKTNFPELFD